MPTPIKSDEEHDLQGSRSQAHADAPPVEGGRPRLNKKNLSKEACGQFRKLHRLLAARRTVTEGDCEILRLYSVLWDRHSQAMEALAQEGAVVTEMKMDSSGEAHPVRRENLWLGIAQNCEGKMVSILDRLGLTPVNRPRVKPTKDEAAGSGIKFL